VAGRSGVRRRAFLLRAGRAAWNLGRSLAGSFAPESVLLAPEGLAVIRRILVTFLVIVFVAVAAGAAYVGSRQNLKFDDTPYPNVTASTDSAVIARGHYVVRTVVNCAQCHGDPTQFKALQEGADIPLSGGYHFDIPPGVIRVRNITPDDETGIGKFSDASIARALRFGVGHDGRALLPFMEMQGLSDEDLVAVVSYLRTQAPVKNAVPMHDYTVLGKIVKATVLANPVGPKSTPPAVTPHGANVENGRYLVESVALCGSCHTQRSQDTGEFTGPHLGGATDFTEVSDPAHVWAPPNITSDPATGKLGKMSEDEFVTRFRAGRILPGSPMPWQGFSRMAEEDLRAIYQYLKTVPPVVRDVGPAMTEAKAKKT
jgi:mono/diheme cytochrome c family protein